ncbi:MAG: glycosyltransferase family 4 protein, partial [Candidatus Omnitrophica bacterium]|nr:glycosyltransferase family 4 protein [Candidatus Omnitrophota bacterium]
MKIAILSWESLHSVSVGGIAAHITELSSALERKGNEVHVFTRIGHPEQSWYELIEGVHYHRCPFDVHPDFVQEVDNMCASFARSFFETEDHTGPFDVVHAHDWLTVNAMTRIRDARGRHCVFTIHSTEYGRCGNQRHGGNSERIRHHEWLGGYAADHVMAVSKSLKDEYCSEYNVPGDKVDVVYNGISYRNYDGWIDPAAVRESYGIGPMDPMVLFVGRMVYQKGPDLLAGGVPYILQYYPNAKFVFVGDGD